jgi:hypothetical protein
MLPSLLARKYPNKWFLGIVLLMSPCFPVEINPPIPPAFQEDTHLCWAASDFMVLRYFGRRELQCNIIDNTRPEPGCCSSSGVSLCNPYGQPTIRKGIYGRTVTLRNKSISWQTIVDGVNQNFPFIFSWYWTGGGGHVMVGVGYHTTLENGVSTNWVDYNDPLWGRDQIKMGSFDHDADHTTAQTHYNIK